MSVYRYYKGRFKGKGNLSNLIYNVNSWAANRFYNKHDIVISNNLYYYSLLDHTSTTSFSADVASLKFGGNVTDNNESKRQFIWRHAFNFNVDNQPKVKKISFQGYTQRLTDGINNLLPVYNLEFQCELNETSAILHFLETCEGSTSFMWLPPAPRGLLGRFICEKWTDTQVFVNNFKIQVSFERTAV